MYLDFKLNVNQQWIKKIGWNFFFNIPTVEQLLQYREKYFMISACATLV